MATDFEGGKEDGVTSINDLRPFLGSCCMITSLYLLWPQCIGGYGNVTFTCFETEFKCCKVSERPEDLCIVQNIGCILVKPTTCLKGVTQCFCCDNRCALPCDDDVPCIFNMFGLNMMYNFACVCKCCAKVSDFKNDEDTV